MIHQRELHRQQLPTRSLSCLHAAEVATSCPQRGRAPRDKLRGGSAGQASQNPRLASPSFSLRHADSADARTQLFVVGGFFLLWCVCLGHLSNRFIRKDEKMQHNSSAAAASRRARASFELITELLWLKRALATATFPSSESCRTPSWRR